MWTLLARWKIPSSPPSRSAVLMAALLFGLNSAGCSSTGRQLLQGQIDLHEAAIAGSKKTLSDLQSSGGGPGDYDIRLYIADRVLNDALKALDNHAFAVPNDPSIKAKIKSIRFSHYGTMPAAVVGVEAQRGDVQLSVEAQALLIPTAQSGEFELRVLSFVPVARWGWFEFTKARFIRDLLAVEVNKLAANLPRIGLPIEQAVVLGGPGRVEDIRFKTSDYPSYLTVRVNYPSTLWNAKVHDLRYFFLKDGIYVFGSVQ